MRRTLTATIFGVVGLVGMLLAAPRPAAAVAVGAPADWSGAFVLRGSGFDNPILWLKFNPQPEPPAHPPDPGLLMDDPLAPAITVPTGTLSEMGFRVLFGIRGSTPLDGTVPVGEPDAGGQFVFDIASAGLAFTVIFDVVTVPDSPGGSSGVPAPGTWQGFNPQPEPPALGTGAAFGFDFDFTHFSDAKLTVQVLDANSAPIAFEQVPAPTTLWLLLAGFAALPWRRT